MATNCKMPLVAEDIAFVMEGREQGFTWNQLEWAFGMIPGSLRFAVSRAKRRGFAAYPLRTVSNKRRMLGLPPQRKISINKRENV